MTVSTQVGVTNKVTRPLVFSSYTQPIVCPCGPLGINERQSMLCVSKSVLHMQVEKI